jgi:hypothetical protein
MIFPPSQTSVALRSTDDELARRVEIKMRCYFVEERQGSRTIFQIDASHCLLMTFSKMAAFTSAMLGAVTSGPV